MPNTSIHAKLMQAIDFIINMAQSTDDEMEAHYKQAEIYFRLLESATSVYTHIEPDWPDYTVKELAEVLRVSYRTAYKLVTDGEIEGYRLNHSLRVPHSSVAAYRVRKTVRNLNIPALTRRIRGRKADTQFVYKPGDKVV